MDNLEAELLYSSKKHNGMIISYGCYSTTEGVKEALERIQDDAISFVVINHGRTLARNNVSGMTDTNWL